MYIYIITNIADGHRQYVGQSLHDPMYSGGRVQKHLKLHSPKCPEIHNAVKEYGADNFDIEIIHYPGASQDAINAIEGWYIEKLKTQKPNGYNIRSGGARGKHAEETRQKIGEANKRQKGKKLSAETRQKISEANKGEKNPFFGKTHSPETRRRISEANKGKKGKPLSKEQRQQIGAVHRGKIVSAETRKKISQAGKGRKHTAEAKQKISAALKGRKRSLESRQKYKESWKRRKAKQKYNPNQLTFNF